MQKELSTGGTGAVGAPSAVSIPPLGHGRGWLSVQMVRFVRRYGGPILVLAVFLLAWQLAIRPLGVPRYLVPRPFSIATNLVNGFKSGEYVTNSWATLQEILIGFVAGAGIGLILGITVSWSALLDRLFTPYIIALNGLPKVAAAPLVVLWLGQGLSSKIVITASLVFFPVVVTTVAGLHATSSLELELMQSFSASKLQTFRKVRFPGALPQVFAGLEIGVVLAPVGAIVGEFVGAKVGLGYLILEAETLVLPSVMFATFVILIVISLILFYALKSIEHRVVFWSSLDSIRTSA